MLDFWRSLDDVSTTAKEIDHCSDFLFFIILLFLDIYICIVTRTLCC
jgi:hypothetical protein